jgi:predicted dehydrogenase
LEKSTLLAGTAAGLSLAGSVHAAGSDVLKIGLVGCGGRGCGAAANALTADANTRLVAVGDAFGDKIEPALKNLRASPVGDRIMVDKDHVFVGLDAYQKVLASGIDLVILATPGAFRPLHLQAAIEAGKHVFCEKPMAVDVPGLRKVIEAAELAKKKGLAIRSGLCNRFDVALGEAMKRVHDGAIGEIVAMYAVRTGGPLSVRFPERQPGWSDLEWQLRNWQHYRWLSGDYMMEVHIHEVDKFAWAMRDVPPVKCVAHGGRATPAVLGNVFDHFDVTYEYAAEMPALLKVHNQANCFSSGTTVRIMGTKGNCLISRTPPQIHITGDNAWDSQRKGGILMFVHEHETLFRDLRAGIPPNDGEKMVKSTLMAMMGRMAAYTGKEITWEMAMKSQEDTMPAGLNWDMKLPAADLAVPGLTPFA